MFFIAGIKTLSSAGWGRTSHPALPPLLPGTFGCQPGPSTQTSLTPSILLPRGGGGLPPVGQILETSCSSDASQDSPEPPARLSPPPISPPVFLLTSANTSSFVPSRKNYLGAGTSNGHNDPRVKQTAKNRGCCLCPGTPGPETQPALEDRKQKQYQNTIWLLRFLRSCFVFIK